MVRHPEYIMGFWSGTSDSQGDELDFGRKWDYEDIREYVESSIGSMKVDDRNLQANMSKLLNEDRKLIGEMHVNWFDSKFSASEIEIRYEGSDTYFRCRNMHKISYVRSDIKRVGFVWDNRQKSWVLKNRKITIEEIKALLVQKHGISATEGLRAYCEKIAYRQTMDGIPNTFSVTEIDGISDDFSPGDSKDTVGVLASNSSKNPYSKIEQLEKLIGLRNKGEISVEEFKSLKKELLS